MMKTRGVGVSRAAGLLLLLLAAGAQGQTELLRERWVRLDTEHFTLVSQAPARTTARYAEKLEAWRRVAASTIGSATPYPKAHVPNYVYLFEDLAAFEQFTYATEPAFFTASPRANFMALIAADEKSEQIAMHHYVHFLVRNFSDLRLPRWYEEGLAGYISRVRIDGDEVGLEGYSATENESMAQLSETFSMDRLLYRDAALASPRVIQIANLKAEALLYYLWHGHQEPQFPDRRAELQDYLALLLQGRSPRFAFDRAFPVTPAQLDSEFHQYLQTSERPQALLQAPPLPAPPEYTAQPLATAPLAILLGEIALNAGRFENARLFFEAAMAADESLGRSYSGLGDALRMQELEGDDQQISAYFEQALARAPADPLIHLDYGEYWETELLDCAKVWPPVQVTRIVADMQQHYQRALALAPESPEANLAMAQLYLLPGQDWRTGRPYQRRAFALLPADTFILEQAVRYAIVAEEFDEAERLIDELAQPIHFWGEPGWVSDLRERLLRQRRGEPYDACAAE